MVTRFWNAVFAALAALSALVALALWPYVKGLFATEGVDAASIVAVVRGAGILLAGETPAVAPVGAYTAEEIAGMQDALRTVLQSVTTEFGLAANDARIGQLIAAVASRMAERAA